MSLVFLDYGVKAMCSVSGSWGPTEPWWRKVLNSLKQRSFLISLGNGLLFVSLLVPWIAPSDNLSCRLFWLGILIENMVSHIVSLIFNIYFHFIYFDVLGFSYDMHQWKDPCRIFNCGMWDIDLWPGIKPGPLALEVQSLSHWTTGKSLHIVSLVIVSSQLFLSTLGFFLSPPPPCPRSLHVNKTAWGHLNGNWL